MSCCADFRVNRAVQISPRDSTWDQHGDEGILPSLYIHTYSKRTQKVPSGLSECLLES